MLRYGNNSLERKIFKKYILDTMETTMESEHNMKMNMMETKILVCSSENNIRTRITLKRDKCIE